MKYKKAGTPVRWRGLKWVFQQDAQAELIALAMLGQSNRAIKQSLAYTDGQIQYALRKAKDLQKMKASIRSQWRDGTSGVAQQVMHDLKAVLIAEVQRDLPKLIVHPTAKTVKIEEPK